MIRVKFSGKWESLQLGGLMFLEDQIPVHFIHHPGGDRAVLLVSSVPGRLDIPQTIDHRPEWVRNNPQVEQYRLRIIRKGGIEVSCAYIHATSPAHEQLLTPRHITLDFPLDLNKSLSDPAPLPIGGKTSLYRIHDTPGGVVICYLAQHQYPFHAIQFANGTALYANMSNAFRLRLLRRGVVFHRVRGIPHDSQNSGQEGPSQDTTHKSSS